MKNKFLLLSLIISMVFSVFPSTIFAFDGAVENIDAIPETTEFSQTTETIQTQETNKNETEQTKIAPEQIDNTPKATENNTIKFHLDNNYTDGKISEKNLKMDEQLGTQGLYALRIFGRAYAYFVGWSKDKDVDNSHWYLFSDKVSDVYPDGIPENAELYPVYINSLSLPRNIDNSFEICPNMKAEDIVVNGKENNEPYTTEASNIISVYNDGKDKYLKLNADFSFDKRLAYLTYLNPGNVLTNGDYTKTYSDINVQLDKRIELPDKLEGITIKSYQFEPEEILAVTIDENGNEKREKIEDASISKSTNSPTFVCSFDASKIKNSNYFTVKMVLRNRVGGRYPMKTNGYSLLEKMEIDLGDSMQYKIPAEIINNSKDDVELSGFVDARVKFSSTPIPVNNKNLLIKIENPKVSYKFKSSSDKLELPKEVLDQLSLIENPKEIKPTEKWSAPDKSIFKSIKITDSGTWVFDKWSIDGPQEIKENTKVVGYWKFIPETTPIPPVIPPTKPENSGGGSSEADIHERIYGRNRIETAIKASEKLYPNGTNSVVLANCDRYTDVLTANPFAVQENASVLFTYLDKLPEETLKEIERLGSKQIYISGGYEAVSKKVVDQLSSRGFSIYRFDGEDRYDTARKIAAKIREKGNTNIVALASGENYPDALSITSMAIKDHAPILLTRKDSIPMHTKKALAEWDVETVKIAGLNEAISEDVEKQLDNGFTVVDDNKEDSNVFNGATSTPRYGGNDRYETSTIIAKASYPESKMGVYATGEDFPDALVAGNYAGKKQAPVLLVKKDKLPKVVEDYTRNSKISKATVIGGVNAVSDKVFDLIKNSIN